MTAVTVEDCLALMDAAKANGMGPGRIAMALKVRQAHPIRDIAEFLFRIDQLLKAITADTAKKDRFRRNAIRWCVERMDRIDDVGEGTFDLRFQFMALTDPSFVDVADGIADLYAALAKKFNEPRQLGLHE